MSIKRFISSALIVILLLSSVLSLTSCTAPQQCNYSDFKAAVAAEDTVTVCFYGDDNKNEYYDVEVNNDFLALLQGEFTPVKKDSKWEKFLTLTVSMQYELCLFDNGTAMIYYGFAGITQNDRVYYDYKLNAGTDALREYIMSNGIIKNMEEESK